jgi:hypothetical protein
MDKMAKRVLDAMKKAGKPLRPEVSKIISTLKGDVAKLIGVESKKEGTVISPKRCYYAPSRD